MARKKKAKKNDSRNNAPKHFEFFNYGKLQNLPSIEGLKFCLIDDDVAVYLNVPPKNGDYAVLTYEEEMYYGLYEYIYPLNLISLELKKGAILLDSFEEYTVEKVIGVCLKIRDFSFKTK